MLSITVAQRYSILVTARNDSSPSNWAIHANMDTDMFDTVPDTLNPSKFFFVLPIPLLTHPPVSSPILPTRLTAPTPSSRAFHLHSPEAYTGIDVVCPPDVTSSITYSSSATTTDSGFVDSYAMLNDTALVPSEVVPMYPPADVTIPLLVFFDTMDDGAFLFPLFPRAMGC